MLTGHEIEQRVMDGRIVIDPYRADAMGANSYDLTLAQTLYCLP